MKLRRVRLSAALERAAIAVASLVLSVGLIALLSGYFAGRDQAGITGGGPAELGQQYPDLGHAHLAPGSPDPPYNSDPPTSGPHVPAAVSRDAVTLSNDQLLQALEAGNVVFMYGTRRPPPGLAALSRTIAGPFAPVLADAGQAVILAHRPGVTGVIGLAWTHLVRLGSPSDPLLRAFADTYLGRGAPGR